MILPAHMSTANLVHLAHPTGEQLEDLQQGAGIRRSDALMGSSANKVDLLAVQKPQDTISAQQVVNNCKAGRSIASEFNTVAQRNRSLQADSTVLVLSLIHI